MADNKNRTEIDRNSGRGQRLTPAEKIAQQRRHKTELEKMQAPRLSTSRGAANNRPEEKRLTTRQSPVSNRNRSSAPKRSSGRQQPAGRLPSGNKKNNKSRSGAYKPLFGKRKPAIPKFKIITGAAVAICIILLFYIFTNKNAVEVFVDGQSIGVVLDKNITEKSISDTCDAKLTGAQGTEVEITSKIETKKVHAGKSDENVVTNEFMLKTVSDNLKYNVSAVTMVLDGKEMAIVSNQEAANTVVDRILSEHKLDYIGDETVVEGPEIVGLEFGSKFVDSSEIITTDQAYEKMNGTKTEQLTYTVVAGDSFGKIASRYGLTTAELMESNPDIKNTTIISIGDEIKVNATVPIVSIRVVTQTVDRSSGTSAIIKKTYINGSETDEATIDSGSASVPNEEGDNSAENNDDNENSEDSENNDDTENNGDSEENGDSEDAEGTNGYVKKIA